MGNRAIYIIAQNGEKNYFYSHMGANALSPLLRLAQAKELQPQLPEPQPIAHIKRQRHRTDKSTQTLSC